MKSIMRKTTALILAIGFALSMGGCGKKTTSSSVESTGVTFDFADESQTESTGSQSSGTQSAENQQSGVNKNNTTSGGAKAPDLSGSNPFANVPKHLRGSTVTFANFGDEGSSEMQKVFKYFTKKTGIKVNSVLYDEDTYYSVLAKHIAAGDSPDVVCYGGAFPSALNNLQPLNDYIDPNEKFWKNTMVDVCTLNGKIYALNSIESPWFEHELLFYNKQIFQKNNIKSPRQYFEEGKWTWEDVHKCMEAVSKTKDSTGKYNIGGYIHPSTLAAARGKPIVEYNTKTDLFSSNVRDSVVVDSFRYCSRLLTDKLWDKGLYFGSFNAGNVGIYVQTTYGTRYNGWFKDSTAFLGAVPLPSSFEGKKTTQVIYFRSYGIAKNAQNPQGAMYFLRMMLDNRYYEEAKANVFINAEAKKAFYESLDIYQKDGGSFIFLGNSTNFCDPAIDDLEWRSYSNDPAQVETHLNSAANVLDAAIKKMNTALDPYKK